MYRLISKGAFNVNQDLFYILNCLESICQAFFKILQAVLNVNQDPSWVTF